MKDIPRVKVTDEAKKVIGELRAKHGALMFHQSGDGGGRFFADVLFGLFNSRLDRFVFLSMLK